MSIARLYPIDSKLRGFSGHAPRRIGQTGIESLTSFLCRLAFEHCCAPHRLYGALVANNWEGMQANLTKIRSAESHSINGLGQVAQNSVNALEEQSDITPAAEMTFLFLSDLCDNRAKHFLHKVRHWCSHCYMDARRSGVTAWEPLYWAPSTTSICVIHGTLLRKTCARCGKTQRHLPKFPFLDFCEYCSGDLADACDPECHPTQLKERIWLATAAIDLISCQREIPLSRENFAERLNDAVKIHCAGTTGQFARVVGILPCNLRNWQLRSSSPTWSNFMDISYRLNVPPSQLGGPYAVIFSPATFNCSPVVQLDKQHRRLPKKKLDEARAAIVQLLESPIDIWTLGRATIFATLKQFGICYQTFQRNFPDLYETFSKRRSEAAEYRKELSKLTRLERVRIAQEKLLEMGLTPSARNLKKSGMVRVSDVVPTRQQAATSKTDGRS